MPIPEKGSSFLRKYRWSAGGLEYFVTTSTFTRVSILANRDVFEILEDSAIWMQGKNRWQWEILIAMPDHLHMIFKLGEGFELGQVMLSFKGFTGNKIKERLGLDHPVWQEQYYDHQIRNQADFNESFDYCLYNPVKKGLADKIGDYPWCVVQQI